MMMRHMRRRRWPCALLLVVVVLLLVSSVRYGFFHLPEDRAPFKRTIQTAGEPVSSPAIVRFWDELLDILVSAKPRADPIVITGAPKKEDMDPKSVHKEGDTRVDIAIISGEEESMLHNNHEQFVKAMKQVAPRMPFEKGTRGIVTTAGGYYLGMAVTSLVMLRRTGSTLPVQVFLDSSADFDEELCGHTLPSLDAECILMEEVFASTPRMPKLEKYQFKVFAIIFSSFQEVFFMDADAFPIHKPDMIFDANPFKSYGLVTWPDHWFPTVSPRFYRIAGITPPPIGTRASSESGIMLYDKTKHADSLLLAAYYNFYGPDYYYPLLSQNAHGQGDKETFMHAAMVLGNPFYDVKTPIGFLGRWLNGSYDTAGMKQADPVEDYKMQVVNFGQQGHLVSTSLARPMFIHHNLVKIDVRRLGTVKEGTLRIVLLRNETGQYSRLWGTDERLNQLSGYDVERALWDTILDVDCRASLLLECEELREYVREVF